MSETPSMCHCLAEAVMCEACGALTRMFVIGWRRKFRFELFTHHELPDGSTMARWLPHTPARCRATRERSLRMLLCSGEEWSGGVSG